MGVRAGLVGWRVVVVLRVCRVQVFGCCRVACRVVVQLVRARFVAACVGGVVVGRPAGHGGACALEVLSTVETQSTVALSTQNRD